MSRAKTQCLFRPCTHTVSPAYNSSFSIQIKRGRVLLNTIHNPDEDDANPFARHIPPGHPASVNQTRTKRKNNPTLIEPQEETGALSTHHSQTLRCPPFPSLPRIPTMNSCLLKCSSITDEHEHMSLTPERPSDSHKQLSHMLTQELTAAFLPG